MSHHEQSFIDATRESLAIHSYPGYPSERLHLKLDDIPEDLTLPEGAWTASSNEPPTPYEQERLRALGLELDSSGRPLHPWLIRMLTDPKLGVVTGKGYYWNWGPNHTADPIVITDEDKPKVLLIQRSDTRVWALPGGFIDEGETAEQAARRELFEEAGLLVLGDNGTQTYSGVIGDLRMTAHAWGETTAVVWKVASEHTVDAGDDALDAKWFPAHDLPEQMSNHHKILIAQALANIALVDTISHAVSVPRERQTFSTADGGHMAYHRHIIKSRDGNHRFIKSHNNKIFSDPFREENSKWYLQKEKYIYDHISDHVPQLTPGNVELLDNHSLIMEAMSPEDGWHWRAPSGPSSYIDDVIESLLQLQEIPLADDSHIPIRPSHITHIAEGWDAIADNDLMDNIRAQIKHWQLYMNPDFQSMADDLLRDLDTLANEFSSIPMPDKMFLTHHDLRQSNIVWHPEHGTRIIDWSWAGAGRKNSDITTLLIDLHKSGHDIDRHAHHFSNEHAHTLIGFWLGHSLWPTRTDDQSVRFHQVLSAVSAYDLLKRA